MWSHEGSLCTISCVISDRVWPSARVGADRAALPSCSPCTCAWDNGSEWVIEEDRSPCLFPGQKLAPCRGAGEAESGPGVAGWLPAGTADQSKWAEERMCFC